MTTKSQFIKHMENGGQIFRTTSRDKFFYKIEDGKLMCRCNELGGWHSTVEPRWDSDNLQIAALDYEYNYWNKPNLTIKPLPSLEETTQEIK